MKPLSLTLIAAAFVLALTARPAAAQNQQEIEALKKQIEALKAENAALKDAVEKQRQIAEENAVKAAQAAEAERKARQQAEAARVQAEAAAKAARKAAEDAEKEAAAVLKQLKKAVEVANDAELAERLRMAKNLRQLGEAQVSTGKLKEAETWFRKSVELLEKVVAEMPAVGDYRSELAQSLDALADVFRQTGRQAEADATTAKAKKLREMK
jgi:colicin import membrane protein